MRAMVMQLEGWVFYGHAYQLERKLHEEEEREMAKRRGKQTTNTGQKH